MRKLRGSSVRTDTNEKQAHTLRPVDAVGVEGTGVEGILQLIYSLNARHKTSPPLYIQYCTII